MNYEFKDYRPKRNPPSFTEWTPVNPVKYCVGQVFLLFVLPWLLGVALTPMGLLINVVLVDFIFYKNALRKVEY